MALDARFDGSNGLTGSRQSESRAGCACELRTFVYLFSCTTLFVSLLMAVQVVVLVQRT